ncbi:hypothetical protein SLEP1_g41134 [Rubroshorea leprosula]|uniref:Uncharacterized protein n=1 Tax=Rubroshorea leprosula TaxID=152421 RepID=A0AAV5L606_9ROSI|nr:hypothetical protein SLEP1_g41134 [Rubroshorea leprosula]
MKKICDFLPYFEDGEVRLGHLAAGVGLTKAGLNHSGKMEEGREGSGGEKEQGQGRR